jgi:monoamine oxidase
VELAGAGLDVVVLEARDRVGGRVLTARAPGMLPVELGAEFLHGSAKETRAIAAAARLAIVEGDGSHWLHRDAGIEPSSSFGGELDRVMRAVAAQARRGDISFAEAAARARLPARARMLGCSFVEGFNAAPAGRISARSLAAGNGAVDAMARVLGGYDQVPRCLAGRLPPGVLRLGAVVTGVAWQRSRVRVRFKMAASQAFSSEVRARKLVIALPLGVLAAQPGQEGAVRFDPPLAPKGRALSRLATGNVVRLVIRFRTPFWREAKNVQTRHRRELRRLAFVHAPRAPIATWWTTYPIAAPILVAWAGGPAADALWAAGRDAIVTAAVESLAHAFGAERRLVEEQIEASFIHDWAADPFARGAYSYPLVGGVNAGRSLGQPLLDTLFFAGEATAPPPDNGTVHGAIASGQRAAREILASLRRRNAAGAAE